jgi:hypothetical protein
MVQSNGGSGNGSGQQEYNPEVEFEYLDADVWVKTSAEGNQDVAYTDDVLEAVNEPEEDESESDDESDEDESDEDESDEDESNGN